MAKIPVKNPWEIFAYLPFGNWNECPEMCIRDRATITAQGVSFMGSLVYLRRYQPGFSLRKIEFHREKLLAILKVGLPTAIQMVVVNTAYLLVTGMLNQFGTPVAAASGVGLKINTFAGMHCWAIDVYKRQIFLY